LLRHGAVASVGRLRARGLGLRGRRTVAGVRRGAGPLPRTMAHRGVVAVIRLALGTRRTVPVMSPAGARLIVSIVPGLGLLAVPGVGSRSRRGLRAAGSHGAVPVSMPGALERFAPFLDLVERRSALAGDALLSAAAGQDGKRQEPAGDGDRGPSLFSKHGRALRRPAHRASLDEVNR
jgi:hypothetical protein